MITVNQCQTDNLRLAVTWKIIVKKCWMTICWASRFPRIDVLDTRCFSQSMFLTVDVIDSRCFRAKSRCCCSQWYKSRCCRYRTNGVTRNYLSFKPVFLNLIQAATPFNSDFFCNTQTFFTTKNTKLFYIWSRSMCLIWDRDKLIKITNWWQWTKWIWFNENV